MEPICGEPADSFTRYLNIYYMNSLLFYFTKTPRTFNGFSICAYYKYYITREGMIQSEGDIFSLKNFTWLYLKFGLTPPTHHHQIFLRLWLTLSHYCICIILLTMFHWSWQSGWHSGRHSEWHSGWHLKYGISGGYPMRALNLQGVFKSA